jgi:hypothetical protein
VSLACGKRHPHAWYAVNNATQLHPGHPPGPSHTHLSAAMSASSAATPHSISSSTMAWFLQAVAYSPAQ